MATSHYNADTAITIDSVSKAFANRSVLKNINLSVDRGQSVCVFGVNGVGKSTLLRIVSGLLQPDRGMIQIKGHNVNQEPEESKRQLGMISHKSMVYSELTVLENLSFFATLYGVNNRKVRVDQMLHDMGLSPYRHDRTDILSRGMLQRLAIARALIHEPTILVADEPFAGLDTDACQHLVTVFNEFVAGTGTILMTSHDTNAAMPSCSRVVVLDKTELIFDAMLGDIDTAAFAKDYLLYVRNKQ